MDQLSPGAADTAPETADTADSPAAADTVDEASAELEAGVETLNEAVFEPPPQPSKYRWFQMRLNRQSRHCRASVHHRR